MLSEKRGRERDSEDEGFHGFQSSHSGPSNHAHNAQDENASYVRPARLRLLWNTLAPKRFEKDTQNEPPERPKSLPGGARGTQNRSREAPGAAPGRPGPPGVGVSAPRAPPEAEKGAQKDPEKSPREGPGKSRGPQKGRAGQKTVRAQRFRTLKIATACWDRCSVNDWSIVDLRTLRIVWQGYTMLHFSTFRKGRRK